MRAPTRPTSIDAARQAGAQQGNAYIAGGTALQLQWIDMPQPACLTDLSGLPGWGRISQDEATLRISAGATLEQCRTDARVLRHAPLLSQACSAIGAFALRNLGTLGGNIGWRLGDTLPALLATGAEIEGVDGKRQQLSTLLEQTPITVPLPLIIAVHVPLRAGRHAVFLEKAGHRAAFSPTVVLACGRLQIDDGGIIRHARLAVSAAGLPARRVPVLERAIIACDARDKSWHTDFAALVGQETSALAGIQPSQQQMLSRLLQGHLYQLCEAA